MRNRASRATPRSPCRSVLASPLVLAAPRSPLAAPPAQAEKADRFKPLNVEADLPGKIDLLNQFVVFTGNVVVTKGTMTIRARADRGARDARRLPHGGRLGSPGQHATFRQKRDGARRIHRGRGRAARVRRQVRRHPLRQQRRRCGACAARRPADEITGNLITYDSTHRGLQRHRRRAGDGRQPGRPRARRADAARKARAAAAEAARARASAAAQRAGAAARRADARGQADERATRRRRRRRRRAPPRGARPAQVLRHAHGRRRTCAWRSRAARWSACSARTAPARRRAST